MYTYFPALGMRRRRYVGNHPFYHPMAQGQSDATARGVGACDSLSHLDRALGLLEVMVEDGLLPTELFEADEFPRFRGLRY